MAHTKEQELSDHVDLDKQTTLSDEEIQEEFYELSQVEQAPSTIAHLPENVPKNRYYDIMPADFSLVHLKPRSYTNSDYCNGSWLKGVSSDRDYIAINGPLKSTLVDFYEMIYQYEVKTIVQLTSFVEGDIEKCYYYLPKSETTDLTLPNQMTISIVSSESNPHSQITLLKMEYNGETKLIKHYYFNEWKDQKVPQNPHSILLLQQAVLDDSEYDTTPKVIHCSAGVGRTGTFIAIDYFIRKFYQDGSHANILDFVKNMRLSRPRMVQTIDQYRFVYKAISRFLRRPLN